MTKSIAIVALQGFAQRGDRWVEQASLRSLEIIYPFPLLLFDGSRHNWPAALRGDRRLWRIGVGQFRDWLDGRKCILIGHSDGASMACRLAITLRDSVLGVVSYAGKYRAFSRHENIFDERFPAGLFLNNTHDQLVHWDNAQKIYDAWNGPRILYFHSNPEWKSPIESHEWKPDFAIRHCAEFIGEIHAALQGRSYAGYQSKTW